MNRRTLLKAMLGIPFVGAVAKAAAQPEPLTFKLPEPWVPPDPDDHARHIREHQELFCAARRLGKTQLVEEMAKQRAGIVEGPECCGMPMWHSTDHAGFDCETCGTRMGYAQWAYKAPIVLDRDHGATEVTPGKAFDLSTPDHWHPEAVRCVMCGGTGVHDCPGGNIRYQPGHEPAFHMPGTVTTMFPGRICAKTYNRVDFEIA